MHVECECKANSALETEACDELRARVGPRRDRIEA